MAWNTPLFSDNLIHNNTKLGILLIDFDENIVRNNTIRNNTDYSIAIEQSVNNKVTGNTISGSRCGIGLDLFV